MIPTREERETIRRNSGPDAQDSRHEYRWSSFGICVTRKTGEWSGFYHLREYEGGESPPTRLILQGGRYGDCPGELAVDFVTMGDIHRGILDGYQDNPVFVVRA